MTNLLTGYEDYIVSHTRREIIQKFNVNYNYVNNFCKRSKDMRFCIKCGHTMEHDYLKVGWVCPYCGYKE